MTTFLNKIMSTPIHTKTTHWSYENLQLHGKKYSSFNLKNDEKKEYYLQKMKIHLIGVKQIYHTYMIK